MCPRNQLLDKYNGAKNRIENIIKLGNKADFYIAIKSGITHLLGKCVILKGDESGGFSPLLILQKME